MDDFMSDPEFVAAVSEDHSLVVKELEFQVKLLEELTSLDNTHPFLQKNDLNQLRERLAKAKQEESEFMNELRKLRGEGIEIEETQTHGKGNESKDGGDGKENDNKSVYI